MSLFCNSLLLRAWTRFRTPSSCFMLSKVSNFLLLATTAVSIDCLVKRQRTVLSINYCQVKEGCITPRVDWFLTISKLWTNSIVWTNGYNMDKAKIIRWISEKYKIGTKYIFIIFIFIINSKYYKLSVLEIEKSDINVGPSVVSILKLYNKYVLHNWRLITIFR